jgi:hypothetical protein
MKPALKLFFYLAVISAIAANLAAPATASASEPLIIGIPHSEAFTHANMMRNSFEMALEDINKAAKISSVLAGGAGGVTSQKFVAAAGTSANNLLTATLWTPQLKYPGTKAYYDRYADRW